MVPGVFPKRLAEGLSWSHWLQQELHCWWRSFRCTKLCDVGETSNSHYHGLGMVWAILAQPCCQILATA